MNRAQPDRASSSFVRPERASLSFAFLLYLPPLWRAARPRSESSVGGPVIICLLFHLPTFMVRGPSRPAYHCLSAQFAPVMARGPSSERALRRRPSYHLPFVSFAHLYGARLGRASFSLPFCPIFPRYGARPERASLSFAFLLNLPPFWRAARASQLINALLLYRARSERASLSFARPERASLSFALMPDLRRSLLRVKSAPRAGGRLIILSRKVTHTVASMPKTAKFACVAKTPDLTLCEAIDRFRSIAT